MRVALISDIHGNFVALQTVLDDIERAAVDRIVCLGDVAANGPQPREVIEKIRALDCPMVRGNTDDWFLVPQRFDPNSERERRLMAMRDWAMEKFSPADLDFMRAFQPTIQLPLDNGVTLLCYHGSPHAHTDVILATTPDDELARMIGAPRAMVLAGGHTHQQMLRRYRDAIVLTVGSVGMPFERGSISNPDRHPARGEYAIVDARGGHLAVELRRVPLDVDAVVRAARASGMPSIDAWVAEWSGH
jgi:predicted phosphodiesterase